MGNVNSAQTGDGRPPPTAECNVICTIPSSSVRVHSAATIRPLHSSMLGYIFPPPHNSSLAQCSSLALHSSASPYYFFIYWCYPALLLTLSLAVFHLAMVSTHIKNKNAHPAAPVMTKAARKKAGIPTKSCPKRVTKDQIIKELQARLAALEDPNAEPFSKEPLVSTAWLLSDPDTNNV